MLRVVDLLSLPEFEKFRLVSDVDGLHNIVSGAGILEWETPREIATDFSPNDFVVTTLYMAKGNFARADEGLKALIKRRVSAIALKTIYDTPCSQEVIDMANLYKIPIFVYTDVYMEDLIYTIKSAVFANNSNEISLDYLKFLMEGSPEKAASTAKKLNTLFCDNLVCICCIPASQEHTQVLDNALDSYRKILPVSFPGAKSYDTFIRCNRCIMIIHTTKETISDDLDHLENLLPTFGIEPSLFRIGFSRKKESLSLIREAVDESISAAISALSRNEKSRGYDEIGTDMLILPNIQSKAFTEFYESIQDRLAAYDESHTSNLISTLLCYIESEGDIALTAKKMFQHGNTIRYRLDKIKTLLGISGNPDAYVQLYIYAQLHKLHHLLGSEPLI